MIKYAGNRVQRIRTPVTESQMAQAIINVWQKKFGSLPSKEQVAMVLAQNDLETGNRKSMWNYNVGNITTSGKDSFDYFDDLTTSEQVSKDVWKKMNLKYRAYPTLEAGVEDYLNLLSSGRYTKAWEHIKNPNPESFSKALKSAGYYTANEAPYTKSLISLFNKNYKSNSYDKAISNTKESNTTSIMPSDINDMLNSYLKQVAASNKKIYAKYLPTNYEVIKVKANDYTDAIEFGHVLCSVLETELLAKAFVHTDGKNVDVECCISGPIDESFAAIEAITNATSEAFKTATSKIGNVIVETKFIRNKKSHRDHIDLKVAESQHRKFLLKFI